MPTCKITYNKKSFWIEEFFMQTMYHFIYEELIKPEYVFVNKDGLLHDAKFHIDGYSTGIMWLGWSKFIKTDQEILTMIRVLENLKTELIKKGEEISVEELQQIPTEDEHFKRNQDLPFPVSELVKISNALIEILQGNGASDDYYLKIDYN